MCVCAWGRVCTYVHAHINILYMRPHIRTCVRARVRVRTQVRACEGVHVRERLHVHVCALAVTRPSPVYEGDIGPSCIVLRRPYFE